MTKGLTLSNAGNESGNGQGVVVPIDPFPPQTETVQQAGFNPFLAAVIAAAAMYWYKKDVTWSAGAGLAAYGGAYYYNQNYAAVEIETPMPLGIEQPKVVTGTTQVKTQYDNTLINPNDL